MVSWETLTGWELMVGCGRISCGGMPRYVAEPALETGDFVELIPEWRLKPLGVFAVWPDQSRRENLSVLFARFLADEF